MSEPTVTLALTERQQHIVLDALLDKELESERYVSSYGVPRPPGPMDTCCSGHRHAYDRRNDERVSLATRHADVQAAIAIIKDTEPQRFDSAICRELAAALNDREDESSVAAAVWLADNENDDVLWQLIGGTLDEITTIAVGTSTVPASPRTETSA